MEGKWNILCSGGEDDILASLARRWRVVVKGRRSRRDGAGRARGWKAMGRVLFVVDRGAGRRESDRIWRSCLCENALVWELLMMYVTYSS